MPPEPRDDVLPPDLAHMLAAHQLTDLGETDLRRELERHLPGYTLYKLTPAAARRWKCKYRLMFTDTYVDGQSAAEAYARALLVALGPPSASGNSAL